MEITYKAQKLNSMQLGLLNLAFARNLFAIPEEKDILYLENFDGCCTFFFRIEYYNYLRNDILQAYNNGRFAVSNASIDWYSLKNAIETAIEVEIIDESAFKIYSLNY